MIFSRYLLFLLSITLLLCIHVPSDCRRSSPSKNSYLGFFFALKFLSFIFPVIQSCSSSPASSTTQRFIVLKHEPHTGQGSRPPRPINSSGNLSPQLVQMMVAFMSASLGLCIATIRWCKRRTATRRLLKISSWSVRSPLVSFDLLATKTVNQEVS